VFVHWVAQKNHAKSVKITRFGPTNLAFLAQIHVGILHASQNVGYFDERSPMNTSPAQDRPVGFSLIELLLVLAIIGILAALLLPVLAQGQARARQIQCLTQLRENGIAFHSFAHDHNGKFPMAVPAGAGGTLELSDSAYRLTGEFYFSYRHFQALSNELVTPKLVVCPADKRPAATNFAALRNENLSYFVGLNADMAKPASILAGDRNITNDRMRPASLLHLGPNQFIRWTSELHRFRGNLLFADGHGELRAGANLVGAGGSPSAVADLLVPSVKPTAPAVARASSFSTAGSGSQPPPTPVQTGVKAEGTGTGQWPPQQTTVITSQRGLPTAWGAQDANLGGTNHNARKKPADAMTPKRTSSSVTSEAGSQPWFGSIVAEIEQLVRDWLWAFYLLLLLLLVAMIVLRLHAGRRSQPKPLAHQNSES
jgi:prepilin-type N-terminal cleavage/methylation domain-containing protein/prepilin-type processing-associated H-X9-DG protein